MIGMPFFYWNKTKITEFIRQVTVLIYMIRMLHGAVV